MYSYNFGSSARRATAVEISRVSDGNWSDKASGTSMGVEMYSSRYMSSPSRADDDNEEEYTTLYTGVVTDVAVIA